MKRLSAILFILSCSLSLWAQQVTDVSFTLVSDTLTITYSLDKPADICVRVAIDGGRYTEPLTGLAGAVGKGVKAGEGLIITAVNLPEIRGVEAEALSFLVEVDDGALLVYVGDRYFRMMPVEGGSFTMGCTHPKGEKHTYADELPTHRVTLNGFYIGQYEVTQGLWTSVMGENPSKWTGNDSLPVEQVSWNDVQIFIARLSQMTGYRFRLPTEAEWEFAARGGNKGKPTKYAGSNDFDSVAWYCNNSGNVTHEVKGKFPNELGLYDMSGNVDEWCSDSWVRYSDMPQTNPRFTADHQQKVRRGGGCLDFAKHLRVSDRRGSSSRMWNFDIGLRLAE